MPKRDKKRVITIYLRAEIPAESRKRLYEVACALQKACNLFFQDWELEHVKQGHDLDLAKFLDAYAQWKKSAAPKEERPVLGWQPTTSDWLKRVGSKIRERFPFVHGRVLGLQSQWLLQTWWNKPSAAVPQLKLWQTTLLGIERGFRTTWPMPIRFDKKNASLAMDNEKLVLLVRADRYEVEGKGLFASHVEPIVLILPSKARLKKRLCQWAVEAAEGRREWHGSQIIYQSRKRRWMVALVVTADPPAPDIVQAAETGPATLQAGEDCCWLLSFHGRSIKIGSGRQVERLRMRLFGQVDSRRGDPMGAPSRNGHGRKRRLAAMMKLSGRWERHAKTLNYQLVSRVIKELTQAKVGTLQFIEPQENALMNTLAKECGGPEWPYFQLREILKRKCRSAGIAYEFSKLAEFANAGAEVSC